VRQARPAAEALQTWSLGDEAVLASTNQVFRLPLTPDAAERHAVHVRALPMLRTRVPVALPAPRYVGVMPDGSTPFTAEPRLPGAPLDPTRALGSITRGQLQGVLAALAAVPVKEARQWGVPGDGEVLLHGDLRLAVLLADGPRLTAVTGWRLRLGTADEALDPALSVLLR
jgi:aminoglycoside phosphotransferase (APT) family kinase protein